MNDRLKKAQQRALQYWFEDGLAEISGGLICLLLAVLFFIQHMVPGSPLINMIFLAVAFACAFAIRRFVLWIKARTTYPRTGYVAYKSGWENRTAIAIAIAFGVILLGLQVFLILKGLQTTSWIPLLGGLIFAFIFASTAYRAGMPRFYFLALFCLLTGSALAISGLGDLPGAALLSGLIGLILLAFGAWTRWNYTHNSPPQMRESDG